MLIAPGVEEESVIISLLQFLVALGVYPYLSPGVGVPLQRRLSKDLLVLSFKARSNQRLQSIVEVLFSCLQHHRLSQLVFDVACADLFATLAQLAFEPLEGGPDKQAESTVTSHISITAPSDLKNWTLEGIQQADERWRYSQRLQELCRRLSCEAVFESCFALSGHNVDVPGWFNDVLTSLLVETTMRPGGVAAVFHLLLTSELCLSGQHWSSIERLSAMLSSLPRRAACTLDQYYCSIAPQRLLLCFSVFLFLQ
jgi:hypothetical protein